MTFERDMHLLSLFPHMHLRGKSFRYELIRPDGTTEILLDVPRFDFGWQHRYTFAEPLLVKAGSRMRCTAVYDNSARTVSSSFLVSLMPSGSLCLPPSYSTPIQPR